MKFISILFLMSLVVPPSFGSGLVTGTAVYRERITLPPDAVFEASLEDVSRADAPAEVLGQVRIETPGNPPIRFEISYDEAKVRENHSYSVRARIRSGDRLMFTTDRLHPVLARGHEHDVALLLRMVGGKPPAAVKATPGLALGPLPATFAGELPCADCPGIRYQLDLFPDQVFFRRMDYLERNGGFDDIGTWAVSPDGRTLLLSAGREAAARFAIKDTATLRQLDREGKEILSELNHDLKRTTSLPAVEPRVSLTGMYRYLADAGLFTECHTRRRMPVAQEQDNMALEKAYLEVRREPGAEILAQLEGRIAMRPKMEGEGLQPTVIVDRFIDLSPGETCGSQSGTADLVNTYWRLTRLGDEPVIPAEQRREPYIVLRSEDRRVTGFSGCNRLMGGYELEGDTLAFGRMVSTKMACPSGMDTERSFLQALEQVKTWKIAGEHLELFGADGKRLARFEALYLR